MLPHTLFAGEGWLHNANCWGYIGMLPVSLSLLAHIAAIVPHQNM
jgi:hypothetical protein